MLARDLGRVTYFSEAKERELLELKTKWGYKDARLEPGMENCDICANDVFRDSWKQTGVERRAFEPPPVMRPGNSATPGSSSSSNGSTNGSAKLPANIDQEELVKTITARVMAALGNK